MAQTKRKYNTKSKKKVGRRISPLRKRMLEDMQLNGLSTRTSHFYNDVRFILLDHTCGRPGHSAIRRWPARRCRRSATGSNRR